MWKELAIAFALVLVIEGIVPFLYPRRWRWHSPRFRMARCATMRIVGLMSMLIGTALLYVIR